MKAARTAMTLILASAIAITGCASNFGRFGPNVQLQDGTILQGVIAEKEAAFGPQIRAIQVWSVQPGRRAELSGSYSGTTAGSVDNILSGLGAAAAIAGGMVGYGALRKPDNMNIRAGNSDAAATSNATGGASTVNNNP